MKAATKTNLKLVSLVLGMFCFGFALVPIYDVFCEITGLNGKVSGPTITQYDENFDSREIKRNLLQNISGIKYPAWLTHQIK